MSDELPDHIEEALGKAMDIIHEAESRAEEALRCLSDEDLKRLADRIDTGSLGGYLAMIARNVVAFRAAAAYMDCNGVQQASWPEIWNWYGKKGGLVKRYTLMPNASDAMVDDLPDGEWVRYEDAEAMRAEIERQGEVISDLSAEVVRRGPPGNGLWVTAETHEREVTSLRETLAARQTAAEYSRRQCEKAEASLRVSEMLLERWLTIGRAWLADAPFGEGDRLEVGSLCGATAKELKLT